MAGYIYGHVYTRLPKKAKGRKSLDFFSNFCSPQSLIENTDGGLCTRVSYESVPGFIAFGLQSKYRGKHETTPLWHLTWEGPSCRPTENFQWRWSGTNHLRRWRKTSMSPGCALDFFMLRVYTDTNKMFNTPGDNQFLPNYRANEEGWLFAPVHLVCIS